MHSYPLTVLVLGGMAGCIGMGVLGLYAYTRQRLYAWLAAMGGFEAIYCYMSFRLYSSEDPLRGAHWQFWQLVLSALLVDATILTGLEFLGILRRAHLIAIAILTVFTVGPMWIPGMALTDKPSVKVIGWLGVRYNEMQLGVAPEAFFVVGIAWMGYIAFKLIQRARRGTLRDRVMMAVYLLWWVAGFNDIMVSSGIYTSVYLIEFCFFIIVAVLAMLLLRAEHHRGIVAERERSQLALEVLSKNRDLAAAQAGLTEAAKLAAVGRLASGVAHEVNNPLAYVLVNLQMLDADLAGNPKLRPLVQEALEGIERIRTVVRQLSTFSRSEPEAQSGNVRAAADAAVKMAMVELKARARVEVQMPDPCRVGMDEAQLAQVLLNLLVNAAQSIPPGQRDHNLVRLEARPIESTVEIIVQDTGKGIPEDVLPHIFEPFYTTKAVGEGQGLGLAISRELVRKAGGWISVESVLPHGARFVISLPRERQTNAPKPRDEAQPAAPPQQPCQRPRRALVIDDDKLVVDSVKRMLVRAGFEVHIEHSGRAALELLRADSAFELILCDLTMPDGSGADVLRGIRSDHPSLLPRLLFMSGAARDQMPEPVAGEPPVPLLAKPFGLKEFDAMIQQVLAANEPKS